MQNFGKYEIVAKIGEGGFGVVYEAFDPRIARRVAIKTCPTDDSTLRQRFLHEARISGNLHHRNIIVVYDYGEEGDTPYLVQEFLTGEDLDRKINRGDEISLQTKIDYLVQAADGLDFAHQQGIIHRDIKPSNVRILDDGLVKIMDFGIAKLRDSELALTLPGQTVGTPAYLAPEQIRSLELDARCDIYAFGLLGYEVLTYRKAFPSKNPSRVLYQILNDEPEPLTDLWPECPEDLAGILERCYRKSRDERWSSLAEVARSLRQFLEGPTWEIPRPSPASLRAADRDSETMVTPGGTLEDARRAVQEAAVERARSAAVAARPSPSPAGRDSSPAARPEGLAELQLGGLGSDASPRSAATAAAPRSGAAGGRAALVAVAIAVLAAGGWLGLNFLGSDQRAHPTELAASPGEAAAVESDASLPSGDPAADTPTSPSPAQEPPADRPPAVRSVIVLRASWDPAATATVGDRPPVRLDRDQTIEVPPGESLSVTFSSGRADYPISESVRVAADRPERTVLESPIAPPGALTVRAGLGAPRLYVSVDGEDVGWTPINTRLLPPGAHEVIVSSDDSDAPEARRSYELALESQEEVVLTFDLRRESPSVARRPYRS